MLYRHTLDMLSDIVSSRKINEDIDYDITLTVVTQYDRIIADLDGRKEIPCFAVIAGSVRHIR